MSVILREWDLVKKMFANGGRWLIIANFYFAAAIAILAFVVILTQCAADPYSPLRNPSPQDVEELSVPQGGLIHVTATKCNDANEAVVFDYSTVWRRKENRDAIERSAGGTAVRDPGCTTTVFENEIPVDLPIGMWRIEGTEIARIDGHIQVAGWYTDWVEITEGER